jgi:hypothetical protein
MEGFVDLVLQPKTPLHEVRGMEFSIRNGCDRNRRQACIWISESRGAGKRAVREAGGEQLVGGGGSVDGAVRNARSDGGSTNRAEQSALKCVRIRGIRAHQIGDAARQDVAEQSEPRAQNRVRRDLQGDGGSRLQDGRRRGGENCTQLRLNHLVERLIHIVGNGLERPREARDVVVRIQRIGIVRIADAEGPGQRARDSPCVLPIKVEIEEVEGLRIG